jgi:hypothetical protein
MRIKEYLAEVFFYFSKDTDLSLIYKDGQCFLLRPSSGGLFCRRSRMRTFEAKGYGKIRPGCQVLFYAYFVTLFMSRD